MTAHPSAYRRSTQKRVVCRRKAERGRRLRSKRCVCPCEPPRLIVILSPFLSIPLWRRSPQRAPGPLTQTLLRTSARFGLAGRERRLLLCQRIMAVLLRQVVFDVLIGLLLLCTSCEKHPLGEMPDVQREQVDPAKTWSKTGKIDSEKPSSSPTPAEFFPESTPP